MHERLYAVNISGHTWLKHGFRPLGLSCSQTKGSSYVLCFKRITLFFKEIGEPVLVALLPQDSCKCFCNFFHVSMLLLLARRIQKRLFHVTASAPPKKINAHTHLWTWSMMFTCTKTRYFKSPRASKNGYAHIMLPGAALTSLVLTAVWLEQNVCSTCLFVTEKTSLFKFIRSNTRNDTLKASLDTVKLHWNCMILPSGCSALESPEGCTCPLWILKVVAVLLSPLFSLLWLRKEHELMAYWEYFVLSPSPYSAFPKLPLEMCWKAAHSMAKHTTRSCWCPWCLSICTPQIMAFTAQLVRTFLPIFWMGTLAHAVLCLILSW